MDFLRKNQILILVVVLLGGAFYVYSAFFKSDAALVVTQDDITAQAVGAEVIELQNRISSVRLRQTLFTSSLFDKLIDFSVPIVEQPIGRSNPFAALGLD